MSIEKIRDTYAKAISRAVSGKVKHKHYPEGFRKEVISLLLSGTSQAVIMETFSLPSSTISSWKKKYAPESVSSKFRPILVTKDLHQNPGLRIETPGGYKIFFC